MVRILCVVYLFFSSRVRHTTFALVDVVHTFALPICFEADLAANLLYWLAPQAGERILDLGCGDGVLSEKLLEAGAQVIGADASPELVAAARERGIDAQIDRKSTRLNSSH